MSIVRASTTALCVLLASAAYATGARSQVVQLWPRGAPGSEGKTAEESVRLTAEGEHIVSHVHRPSITAFLPERSQATGTAVIVIPGGGHRELWMDHEGYRVGQWLSAHGIAAFVLKYRLAREEGSTYTVEGEALADVQRAIRVAKSRAAEWRIASDRIGVLGFSAGGELAALAGTRYDAGRPGAEDPIDRLSSRPAFMALMYPAIPRDMTLTRDTPPTFLMCGESDSPAISDGVATLYLALKHAGTPVELHILTGVGHGFGIRDGNPPAVAGWTTLLYDWLAARHLSAAQPAPPQISTQMREGIPNAMYIPPYSPGERASAAQRILRSASPPALGQAVTLTPNDPYAIDGSRLSIWKPSFVLGTANGGEVGVNFWGIHNEGHVNIGFRPASGTSTLLDCRLLSAGRIGYRIYDGQGESPSTSGERALDHGHFLLVVPAPGAGGPVSVELWPASIRATTGFLGCTLSPID
jgi:endo-1,4-beta-xylanase